MMKGQTLKRIALLLAVLTVFLMLNGCNKTDETNGDATKAPAATEATDATAKPNGNSGTESSHEKVTLAIFSDVHYGEKLSPNATDGRELTDPEGKLRKALDIYYQKAPDLDAICVAGDLTDNGKDEEYQVVTDIINSYIEKYNPDTKVLYTMGNHEFYKNGWGYGVGQLGETQEYHDQFELQTGSGYETDLEVGGIHILGFSPDDEIDAFAPREEWLMEHIEAAAKESPDRPIILIGHKAIEGTVVGTDKATKTYTDPQTKQKSEIRTGYCADWSDEFLEFLKDYPQIIYFSGHTHHLISDPLSIHQEYITSIQCGTMGSTTGFRDTSGFYERYGRSMGYLVTIDENNVVTIEKMNFTDETTYGDPYVLDIPKIIEDRDANFAYTDKRAEGSKPPVFGSDAKVEAICDDESLTVKWTAAQLADDDETSGFILMYKIKIFDCDDEEYLVDYDAVPKRDYYSHYTPYYSSVIEDTLEEYLEDILFEGTQYRVEITAVTPFGAESEPITCEFVC